MSLFSIASLLACLSCYSLGCLVFLKDRTAHLNQSFGLISLLAGTWTAFPFIVSLPESSEVALTAGRAIYLFAPFVPTAFAYFVLVLLGIDTQRRERVVLTLMLICSAVFALSAFHPVFIEGVNRQDQLYAPVAGPLYLPFTLFFALGCGYAFYKCFIYYRRSSGARRNQLRYVLTSFAFAYSAGFLHFSAAIVGFEPFPHDFLLIVFAGVISYAIARHRLMDITVVVHKGVAYALLLSSILLPVYVAVLISQRATPFSVPPLLAGSLILASGLWIVLKNPRVTTNVTFGLLCLSAAGWLFGFFMIYSTDNQAVALLWGKLLHIGIIFVPAFFYHFCVSFLNISQPTRSIWFCYAASSAFLLLLPTDFLISGQYQYFWGFYPKAGILHPAFLAYFVGIGTFSLYRLYKGYKSKDESDHAEATRIKFVFWSFLLGYASAVDFTQNYGVEFYPGGFVFASLWVLLVTYAIAKYQLLDISLIFSRAKLIPYVQGLTIFLSFYLLTLFLIRVFTGSTRYLLAAILLASFVICAELLVNIQRRMERAVGKALFREKHDAYETLSAFSNDLVTILDLNNLNDRFLGVLSRVLNIQAVSLFLLDKEKQVYALASAQGVEQEAINSIRLSSSHPLTRKLALTKAPVVREELEQTKPVGDEAVETLKSMHSEACIPLVNKERLVGFCNLGPRARHAMYSTDDLELLTTLAQNAAIALDNAMLYEDVKNSQLLMRRTDRLRSLETIAGGFAHEIRNPLTSIKTFIQLAPERKDDPEFISGFSRVVNDDVHRIERLIEEILDYARYMKPKLTLEDVNDIVSSCLYFVQVKADSLGIGIERELAPRLPYVMLDRQQIKQVLLNLLLNALDAMKEAGGQLTIRTHQLVKGKGREWVQIEVTDSGPGIDQTNLEHIFDPFYTTKHESGEREGTGLGLAIVHQIVQEHHGTIEVSSQTGRGTTFFVNLPASSQVAQTSAEQEEHEKAGPVGR